MGGKWHEDGMLLNKRNTFTDFIACAEYLIENKYGSKEKLCITSVYGDGGLLIGAILNMRPDLFKAAVLDYPFVDVVTSLLEPTNPETTYEWKPLTPLKTYPKFLSCCKPMELQIIILESGKIGINRRQREKKQRMLGFRAVGDETVRDVVLGVETLNGVGAGGRRGKSQSGKTRIAIGEDGNRDQLLRFTAERNSGPGL
ncbi:hypothetical protein KSP39_PZI011418 [Platanthera zijinensis]|uniref:Prolyl endopeptidase-like n=1 Tax=Platanthera zijinensis TaxID=2320716 RepID=A0AAP0G5G0_9ASPA